MRCIQIKCIDNLYTDDVRLRSTCTTCITCLKRDVSISIIINRKIFYIKRKLQDSNGRSKTIQITLSARVRHPTRREKKEETWNEMLNAFSCTSRIYICIIKYMYIRARTDSHIYSYIHTYTQLISCICNIAMKDNQFHVSH